MPSLPLPNVVLFDLGNTILRERNVRLDDAFAYLVKSAPDDNADALKKDFHKYFMEIRRNLRRGIMEYPFRQFLQLALDCANAQIDQSLDHMEIECWKRLCDMIPMTGIQDVLNKLQELEIPMGIVSNAMFSRRVLQFELEKNGLLDYFSMIVSSADYGIQKPHPKIFQAALAKMNANPATTWFFGDNFEKDIMGASALGMPAFWITPRLLSNPNDYDLPPTAHRLSNWQEFLPYLA